MVTRVSASHILRFLSILLFLTSDISSEPTLKDSDDFDSSYTENILPSPNKTKYEEQISCDVSCIKFQYDGETKIVDEVWSTLGKNSGKVLIEITSPKLKIDDPKLESFLEYFREISKRGGNVSFEPYYIGYKGLGLTDVPLFNDIFGISYNIFKRLKSYFLFSRLDHYYAKVLYHPKNQDILLIFFFQKSYGSLCDTVYSTCQTLQYVDDDTFDLQLSKKLSLPEFKYAPIEIKFDQVEAELPQAKLDLEHIQNANRSSRVYKWLIASKETDLKKVSRERFIDLSLVVTILDYSLKAYELIETIQLYWPIRNLKTEVVYEETGDKKLVKSITISR
ncbi:hypothetical protein EHQ58_10960 [Leptospira ognonensis]|uniref:Uncharacterized protein n=1 Tax=Leptospira ognonensis TaxID=2484945 RepID=A0A4R9K162_9LEPT|nr:hypothetical protein [Leptospira ognonensis]TGL57916.1 hypothetical protein EHQ58_10960 [Leptospira ognonensis]